MSATRSEWIDALVGGRLAGPLGAELRAGCDVLRGASPEEIDRVLTALGDRLSGTGDAASTSTQDATSAPHGPPSRDAQTEADTLIADEPFLAAVFDALLPSHAPTPGQPRAQLPEKSVRPIARLYRRLGAGSRARWRLLRALAADGGRAALAAFAALAAEDPPPDARQADVAFAPLLQHRDLDVEALFPKLLDGIAQLSVAALVLDVANFATRRGLVERHPAADRTRELSLLLAQLVGALDRIERSDVDPGQSPADLRRMVGDAVPIVVAVCDALAIVGDASVIGKLRQALALGHRRLRTEAAAALARLGDKEGIEVLVEMASERVVRNRALAYLEEMGESDKAAEEFRTPVARAEGVFAEWLAQPTQFGLAPQDVSLFDACRQHWPGYAEAVDCYLLRYEFHLPHGPLSGVGIVGPVTHCLPVDLEDLPPADIYAAYAGWHAEHDEIQETDAAELSAEERAEFERFAPNLETLGFTEISLLKMGRFFRQLIPVATAVRGGLAGTVVVEGREIHWFPRGATRRPIGPQEAYYIYKGRKLLRAFN